MDPALRKSLIQDSFNTIAEGYDHPSLRFFRQGAEHLVDELALRGDEILLDLATGTGSVALAASPRLPRGRVLAVDFSPAMLAQARAKAKAQGVRNITFVLHDLDQLRFPVRAFDAVSYAFGLFFMPDMATTLSRVGALVKRGGKLGLCSFASHSFAPLIDVYAEQLEKLGVRGLEPVWQRLGDAVQIAQVFKQAGLPQPQTTHHDVSYRLTSAEQWWDIVWNSGLRGMLNGFDERELAEFKQRHLLHIEKMSGRQGIKLDVAVLCSTVKMK